MSKIVAVQGETLVMERASAEPELPRLDVPPVLPWTDRPADRFDIHDTVQTAFYCFTLGVVIGAVVLKGRK